MMAPALTDSVLQRALTALPGMILRIGRSAALLDKSGLLWRMAGR